MQFVKRWRQRRAKRKEIEYLRNHVAHKRMLLHSVSGSIEAQILREKIANHEEYIYRLEQESCKL